MMGGFIRLFAFLWVLVGFAAPGRAEIIHPIKNKELTDIIIRGEYFNEKLCSSFDECHDGNIVPLNRYVGGKFVNIIFLPTLSGGEMNCNQLEPDVSTCPNVKLYLGISNPDSRNNADGSPGQAVFIVGAAKRWDFKHWGNDDNGLVKILIEKCDIDKKNWKCVDLNLTGDTKSIFLK